MKPWIVKTELPLGQAPGPWWRAVARMLGTWLSSFLRQPGPGNRVADEPLPSSPVSSNMGKHTGSRTPMSASEAEALARALIEEGSLPGEWLARVREGAPELQLPVEENRTPWHRVAPEVMGEISPEEGSLFLPPSPVPRMEPTPSEQPPKSIVHVASDSRTSSTLREPAIRNESSTPLSAPGWSQNLMQRLQDVVRDPLGNTFPLKTQMAERVRAKPETPTESVALPPRGRVRESVQETDIQSPRQAYEVPRQNRLDDASTAHRAEAIRFQSEPGGLSQPSTAFRTTVPVVNDVGVRRGRSFEPRSEEIPASPLRPKMWPSFSDSAGDPAVPIQKSLSSDEVKFDAKKLPVAPASADNWALGSNRRPRSEPSDLWPELPEEQPMQAVEVAQLLRGSERLRALDSEQKGGR